MEVGFSECRASRLRVSGKCVHDISLKLRTLQRRGIEEPIPPVADAVAVQVVAAAHRDRAAARLAAQRRLHRSRRAQAGPGCVHRQRKAVRIAAIRVIEAGDHPHIRLDDRIDEGARQIGIGAEDAVKPVGIVG